MHRACHSIALVFALATPLVAACTNSDAPGMDVALERKVYDANRGVRAIITYRPEVPTGGESEVVNRDGSVSTLHWDGFTGQFTAQIIEGSMTEADSEAFLKDSVLVVCPSVDRALLKKQWVQHQGAFLRVNAQCPKIDAALR